MSKSYIYDDIYIGTIDDALAEKEMTIVTVLENSNAEYLETKMAELREKWTYNFPVFNDATDEFNICELEALASWMRRRKSTFDTKKGVLVHCWSGIERSPFAVAWILFRNYPDKFSTFDEAYSLVKEKRPETQDRKVWLPSWIRLI